MEDKDIEHEILKCAINSFFTSWRSLETVTLAKTGTRRHDLTELFLTIVFSRPIPRK